MTAVLAELGNDTRGMLLAAGVRSEDIIVERFADMRLAGQLHEIAVPLPAGEITEEGLPKIFETFRAIYSRRYTSVYDGVSVQVASYRVRALGPTPKLSVEQQGMPEGGQALKGRRQVWFGGAFVDTPVYDRYSLAPGQTVSGPAIIEERESTTLLGPGDSMTVGVAGTTRIKVAVPAPAAARIAPDTPLETAMP